LDITQERYPGNYISKSSTHNHEGVAMSKKKEGALVVKKAKKPELAAREPKPSWFHEFDKVLEPFRLIPWDPFRGFEWPTEIELPTRIPYVDVIDSGNEYVVKAELPGMKKENVEIEVGTNELILNAKSEMETEEKGKTYLHRERAFSTFHRHIGFAESIDPGKASGNLAEGILGIKLPSARGDSSRQVSRRRSHRRRG
jgi:HSP20 family protein